MQDSAAPEPLFDAPEDRPAAAPTVLRPGGIRRTAAPSAPPAKAGRAGPRMPAFALGGAELPLAVAKWLAGLKSEHTRAAYAADLAIFHAWMRSELGHADLAQVGIADVEAYARHLREERGEKRKTVARRLSTLSAMFARMMATGHAAANPADPKLVTRGNTRTADTPTRWLQGTELQPILDAAEARTPDGALADARICALVHLMTLYGLRVSETTWLKLGDLYDGAHGAMLRVRGKGDTVTHVDIGQATVDVLEEWIDRRARILAAAGADPADPALPLFTTRHGKALSRQAAADAIARFTERALGRRLTPHSLRKSTAIAFHQAGYSHRDLRKWGRWTTLSTVGTYVDVAEDDGHPGLVAADVIASARPQARRAPAGRLRRHGGAP